MPLIAYLDANVCVGGMRIRIVESLLFSVQRRLSYKIYKPHRLISIESRFPAVLYSSIISHS